MVEPSVLFHRHRREAVEGKVRTEEIVEINTAVAISEDALRRLCLQIEEVATAEEAKGGKRPTVLYHGELVGGNKFIFETHDELLAYQNRYERRIATLYITLSIGFRDGVSVIISEAGVGYAFKGTASGEVGEAVRMRHHLEDFASAIRAPWWWMWWNTFNVIFGLGMLVFIAFYATLAFFVPEEAVVPKQTDGQAARSVGRFGLGAIGLIGMIVVLGIMRKRFFPRALIGLGQGKERLERLKKWHWLPIGAMASLLAKIIYDLMTK